MNLSRIVAVSSLVLWSAAAAAQSNALNNAGFESGLGSEAGQWNTFSGGGGFTATTTGPEVMPRTGSRALALGGLSQASTFVGVVQTVAVTPGDAVEWGFWAKELATLRDTVEFRVEFSDVNDDPVAGQFEFNTVITPALTGNYQRFSQTATAPPNAAFASFVIAVASFDGGGEGGLVSIDDAFMFIEDGDSDGPDIEPEGNGPPPPENYELVWADEFNGDAQNPDADTGLDLANWEFQLGTGCPELCGWGNGEAQFYTSQPANIRVEDGSLKITAQRSGSSFTSARIRSIDRAEFTYGQIDVRMRVPTTPGIWPAAWMLFSPVDDGNPNSAGDGAYGGWAASGEIDIFESRDDDDIVHGTIHYGGEFPDNTSRSRTIASPFDLSGSFNTYTLRWTPDLMTWYFNGVEYHTASRSDWFSEPAPGALRETNPRAPFDQPFYLLLNVAVGGAFPQESRFSGDFPAELAVDYVRVYQLQQTPFGEGPAAIPGEVDAAGFDVGYPGDAYSDCDVGNTLTSARSGEDVEIQAGPDEGLAIRSTCPGEWTEYTVDVAEARTYFVTARVTSPFAEGGTVAISSDGESLTTLDVPGGMPWDEFTTVGVEVELDAGEQILRLTNAGGDLSGFAIASLAFGCSRADVAAPFGVVNDADLAAAVEAFAAGEAIGTFEAEGGSIFALLEYLESFDAGCP